MNRKEGIHSQGFSFFFLCKFPFPINRIKLSITGAYLVKGYGLSLTYDYSLNNHLKLQQYQRQREKIYEKFFHSDYHCILAVT